MQERATQELRELCHNINPDKDKIIELINSGADFKDIKVKKTFFSGDYHQSLLKFAAEKNYLNLAELLIEKGADVDETHDASLFTALHIATIMGNKDLVNLLIEKGADVNAKDRNGETPLHLAARIGNVETINALLAADGININATDNKGFTPISLFAINNNRDELNKFLNNNAKVTLWDVIGVRLNKLGVGLQYEDAIGLETTYIKQNSLKWSALGYLAGTAVSLCLGVNIPVISNLNSIAASIVTKGIEAIANTIGRIME